MKKLLQYKVLTGLLFLLIWSCTEQKWDEYYTKPEFLKSGNSFEVLKNKPEYREFVSLLKKTGSDSILMRNDLYTVLALKNGSFSGIDTTSNVAELKKMLLMHIVPSAVFKAEMSQASLTGALGKLLKFRTSSGDITVNNKRITEFDLKTANGVIHTVENVIAPEKNIFDVIQTNGDLTVLKSFIQSDYIQIIDPLNNIKIGFDTLNKPIYQEPINYIQFSSFMNFTKPDDEGTLSTTFLPTNLGISKAIAGMLIANGNRSDMIVPRLNDKHGDTIVGGRYFRSKESYVGDTVALINDIYRHVFVRGEIPSLPAGTSNFINVSGKQLSVSKSQVKSGPGSASNGYYYLLDEVTVPEMFYRKSYMFLPTPKVPNPANPTTTINNPNIIYSNDANTNPAVVGASKAYTGKFTRFNFTKVGGKIEFVVPYVTKGYYKVILGYLPEANHALFSASYGTQMLAQNVYTSSQYNSRMLLYVAKDLGTINVIDHGPVKIAFTCTDSSQTSFNQWTFGVDFMMLEPVEQP